MKHTPILIALLLGAMVALLNETLLGNALTVLMKEFGVTASNDSMAFYSIHVGGWF